MEKINILGVVLGTLPPPRGGVYVEFTGVCTDVPDRVDSTHSGHRSFHYVAYLNRIDSGANLTALTDVLKKIHKGSVAVQILICISVRNLNIQRTAATDNGEVW